MVTLQRHMADVYLQQGKIVVAEGRDTATIVFPDAQLKIYLTATAKVRAERRLSQYLKSGDNRTLESVLTEIKNRDKRDMTRTADPLSANPETLGYMVIDTSLMTEDETLICIIQEVKKKNLLHD
jgi:CMP/dCMP kinase